MIELKFMRIAVRLREKQRRNREKYGDVRYWKSAVEAVIP